MIQIEQGQKAQASEIATLIMEAMNHECCQHFAGEHHTLDDFHRMMVSLVEMEDSQYSYQNTLVAMDYPEEDDSDGATLAGICVVYDGALLEQLRRRFIAAAKEAFGIDYSGMDAETAAGELYVDSLCVKAAYRRKGIAATLLKAAARRAHDLGIACVGLLVDQGNPRAEHLYHKVGFQYVNATSWGGHPMKHLQCKV